MASLPTSQNQAPGTDKDRSSSAETLKENERIHHGKDAGKDTNHDLPSTIQQPAAKSPPAPSPPSPPSPPAHDGDLLAWLQVLGSFLINLNNFGFANSFGAFQAFYETQLLSTHSAASISWIGTLQTALILIVGVVSGPLFDLGFYYPILLGSSFFFVFALMMLSLSTQYYQVMLTWGVLLGICSGLLYVPSVSMLPLYFTKRRGLAIGIATSGAALGGVIYPLMVRRLLDTAGFGWTCRALGFISLATLGAAILLIKPSSAAAKKPVRSLFDVTVAKDLPFLLLIVAGFFLWLGFLVPFILTPTYGLTGLNPPLREDLAYYLLAVPNAAQFFGRIIPGLLSDAKILGAEEMMAISLLVSGVTLASWAAVTNLGGFVVFLIFYGFFCGSLTTMPALVIPYLCPSLAVIGTRMGMVYSASGLGALVGVPIALEISASSHDSGRRAFLGAQLWGGLTILAALGLFVYTAIEARKKRKAVEQKMAAAAAAKNAEMSSKA